MGISTSGIRKFILFILLIGISSLSFGQRQQINPGLNIPQQDYPRSGERYITDQHGVIRMWVNIWGHVKNPGSYLVYDGIELPALISIAGGPKQGARLRGVQLFRHEPDSLGQLSYQINMGKFLSSGDKSEFEKILPNDTYIIPQKFGDYILTQVGVVNTLMSIVNLYYLTQIRREQVTN
ncbi:SLBB domain-containing protein [Candidatus Neomarinimicrobiota bacterium]